MTQDRKKKRHPKKKKHLLPALFVLLLLAGATAFFVYFQVETIEVMENERYTKEEIQQMALRGPLAFNSVLAPLLYSGSVKDIPFVEGFDVRQVNRNTIAISIREKQPVGCIPFLDCYMYFDRTGSLIESSTTRDTKIPYFDGLSIDQVALGAPVQMQEESLLNTAVSLARIFEKNELIPDHILFDDMSRITLEYGNIQVQLGEDTFLEDKMARLIAILPKIRGQKGLLHMESVTADIKTITFEQKTPVVSLTPAATEEAPEDEEFPEEDFEDSTWEEDDITEDPWDETPQNQDFEENDGSLETADENY